MDSTFNLTAVGLRSDFPYVNLNPKCMSIDCPYPGAEVEFLRMNLNIVNATAKLIPKEMTAEEMINMLGNGTADITIFSVIQSQERMEKGRTAQCSSLLSRRRLPRRVRCCLWRRAYHGQLRVAAADCGLVDFTAPVGFIYAGYFIREVAQIEVTDYILTSFRIRAFSLLLLASLTVAVLLYCYSKVFNSSNLSLARFIMATSKGLLKQFQLDLRGPICVRILACAWIWFCNALILHYEAKLRSLLTLTHFRGTLFTNMDGAMDAMEYHGWTMIVQKGGYSPFWYCYPDQCRRLRRLQKRLMVQESSDDVMDVLSKDHLFVFSALTGDLAPYSKSLVDDRRRLLFVRDDFLPPKLLAFAVRKGLPKLVKQLNRAIALTFNSLGTIRGRYQKPYEEYVDTQYLQQKTSLILAHFSVLLEVSAKCYFVATLIFISEVLYFRYGYILLAYLNSARQKINTMISPPAEMENTLDLRTLSEGNGIIVPVGIRKGIHKALSALIPSIQGSNSSLQEDFRELSSCPF